jgi:nucleoside-diphosphate-sugar epimerase
MRIAVTGALGHIGSSLIRALPVEFPGADIVMVDDLSTQRYSSLFDLPESAAYHFQEGDIRTIDLVELFRGADVVIHLAAITNATESFTNRDAVETVNVGGTRRVAEACAEVGAPMIFLSTTSVYGTQSSTVDEDCPESELQPQSPYATSKLEGERLLGVVARERGLRYIACRFGTIFGPSIGMRFHTAINKFCWQATLGEPITVWRTAMHQKRPYLDLQDAVRTILFIIRRDLFDCRIHNVVTVNSTVADIVGMIQTHIPDAIVQFVDTPIMNQLSYEVSSARFRNAGFTFSGDLRGGITSTLELLKGIRAQREQLAQLSPTRR